MHLRIIVRNICANWVGYAVAVVIGFLLSPYLVHQLGKTVYGVWTLIASVTGYFGVLDLGLRQSVGRFVTRRVTLEDHEGVNRTMTTAIAMLASAGFLAVAATLTASTIFGVFHIDQQYEGAAKTALMIAGINISLALPCSVFSTILVAHERFDLTNAIAITGAISRALLAVTAMRLGWGLVGLALIMFAVSLGEYSANAILAKRLYPPLSIRWAYLDRGTCRELLGFGIYRFIWIVANQLIFYTDSVVIGLFLNTAAITSYAIAGSLISYGRNFVSLASDAFYPLAARLDSKSDVAGLQRMLIFGTNIALQIGLPLCLGFIFLGRQFITLWMGKEFASSAVILMILTIPQFTSLPQYISAQVLVGMAKHKVLAQIAMMEAVANLVLSIILIRKIGLSGVAWGTALPHLVTTAIIIPMYTLRILKLSPAEYFVKGYGRPLLCAVPVGCLCFGLSRVIENVTWAVFGGEVAMVAGVAAAMAYAIGLTAEQKSMAKAGIARMLSRTVVVQNS